MATACVAAALLAGALAATGCQSQSHATEVHAPAPAAPRAQAPSAHLPIILIDRDDMAVTQSCQLKFAGPVRDANGNGVVHVNGTNIVVDLGGGVLDGSLPGTPCEQRAGIGIRATGPGLILRNGRIRGFRTAVHATGMDTALIEDLDLSDNFTQRLRSSPLGEDSGDWLWPHANDGHEWLAQYGAAMYLEQCANIVVRRVKAWHGQNGIILDRVRDSQVYDCDCSFLSGWGLALWRSSGNTICRNALDFCVRGYSHGVYNRGQDSAGILCFEQCSNNTFALNSATHCGDGFFGFAGKEALGEAPAPQAFASDAERNAWYKGRGCNGNVLVGNDFSHAVAHGIEHTFSFDNAFIDNICVGDAICGVWGGYSQRTLIAGNRFESCGDGAYGAERGGVNIEHGAGNRIVGNAFAANKAGVHLWWDEDAGLTKTPWAMANGVASTGNFIELNTFARDTVAIELRATANTTLAGNRYDGCAADVTADAASRATLLERAGIGGAPLPPEVAAIRERVKALPGITTPVGARARLGGREAILIGPEGPYDWTSPRADFDRAVAALLADLPEGVEAAGPWQVRAFATPVDPRTEPAAFQAAAERAAECQVSVLNLQFGGKGPSDLKLGGAPMLGTAIRDAALPADGFGIVAMRTFTVPAGCWVVRILSDDGVRVHMNGRVLHDDWTWHVPTEATPPFTVDKPTQVALLVEYFELTGHAVLRVGLERCAPK